VRVFLPQTVIYRGQGFYTTDEATRRLNQQDVIDEYHGDSTPGME
jgi:hypothetical protein